MKKKSDNKNKHNISLKVLIIAYKFPPSASSGSFRSLGFVRHLVNKRWKIKVLTLKNISNELLDKNLMKKIPNRIKIYRSFDFDIIHLLSFYNKKKYKNKKIIQKLKDVENNNKINYRSVKEVITHFIKTPDNCTGWFVPALLKSIFKIHKPNIIYSSAPPFTGHLLAVFLKNIWKVPLVCDFRDPWIDSTFRKKRPPIIDRYEKTLESYVFNNSNIIIANTPAMADLFKNKYPLLNHKIHVITNGFDPEDFHYVDSIRPISNDYLLLIHAGSLYGQRNPIPFLRGLANAVHENDCKKYKVQLIGSIEQFNGKSIKNYIQELKLKNIVETMPSIAHEDIIKRIKGADVSLLFSQGTNTQIPAKLFEYMGIGNPIFSVCEPNSATEKIMKSLKGKQFISLNNEEDIKNNLIHCYKSFTISKVNKDFSKYEYINDYKPFYRSNLAEELNNLLLSTLRT